MMLSVWMRRAGLAFGLAVVLLGSAGFAVVTSDRASAMGSEPKPKVDCRKKKNKDRKECRKQSSSLTDDEIYQASYLLATDGEYAKAKALLLQAANQDDPRILNYLGFTTRKLGDPEAALGFYSKALEARPDYAEARSYLGEALIELGRLDDARRELDQIETICGTACEPYAKLSDRLQKALQSAPATGKGS
ncbi:MAG: tetratricopeptide repeat protein [Pseudomonadota bacterium]